MPPRFVDRVVIHARAGSGGHGCASVHREKFKPLGGPDGGNGGRGGSVILEVDASTSTLLDFHRRPLRKAANGHQGEGSNRNGAAGDHQVVKVPNGTVGLGHNFLRHVERCAALVHVLDCATSEPGRDPVTDLETIEAELAAYEDLAGPSVAGTGLAGRPAMKDRPRIVVLNKIDVPEARDLADLVKPELEARGLAVYEVSAATTEGLRELGFAMAEIVEQARAAGPEPD